MEQTTTLSASQRAQQFYKDITAEGFTLPEGVKSARQLFISKCQDELGLKYNAAATYWQNCRRAAAGGPMYITGSKKATPPAEVFVDVSAEIAQEAKHRWLVKNADGVILSYHKTRAEAKAVADADGNQWADSKAEAAA